MRPGRVELVVQLEWSELATYSRVSSGEKAMPFGQGISYTAARTSFVFGSRR